MFCINIVQPSLELEASNLYFVLKIFFHKLVTVESRNFIMLKPDLNFSSSAFFLQIKIQFLLFMIVAQA